MRSNARSPIFEYRSRAPLVDWRTRKPEPGEALPVEIVSIGCRPTSRGEIWSWHTHPFDELCLLGEDSCTVGHAGVQHVVKPNTLFLHRRGEAHGFWNSSSESPDLWVVHFAPQDALVEAMPALASPVPTDRIWRLSSQQFQEVKSFFIKAGAEASYEGDESRTASSAWMQLLLATLVRYKFGRARPRLSPETVDAELMHLWVVINESVGTRMSEMENLPDLVQNYDSLRHRFRKVFGLSPRSMMLRLRMQRAQQLLLEGSLSLKEISAAVGYWRQPEFTRAFTRAYGVSPSEYRRHARPDSSEPTERSG